MRSAAFGHSAGVILRASTLSKSFSHGLDIMKRKLLLVPSFFLLVAMPPAFAADGKALYEANCTSCHGDHAQGAFPGVPDLIKSGRLTQPDAVLIGHILDGFQSPGSPMAMPPKGGDSSLTAEEAKAMLVYLRSIAHSSK